MVPHDLSFGRIGVTKVYQMTGKRRSSPCPVSETGTIYLYYWGFLLPVMGGEGVSSPALGYLSGYRTRKCVLEITLDHIPVSEVRTRGNLG